MFSRHPNLCCTHGARTDSGGFRARASKKNHGRRSIFGRRCRTYLDVLGNIKYVGATVRVSYFGTRVPGWHRCERQRCSFPPTGHIFSDAMPSALPNWCCMIQTDTADDLYTLRRFKGQRMRKRCSLLQLLDAIHAPFLERFWCTGTMNLKLKVSSTRT